MAPQATSPHCFAEPAGCRGQGSVPDGLRCNRAVRDGGEVRDLPNLFPSP
jgi:hypothetical protein